MNNARIAIIGAGPAGLTLARILHIHGIKGCVFEREAFSSVRPQGRSLDMHADTGQFAIERAGLRVEFNRIARYEDQQSRVYDKYGRLLFVDDDGSEGGRPEVDRAQLRQMLLDSLPSGAIRWGHELSAIRPEQDERLNLRSRMALARRSTWWWERMAHGPACGRLFPKPVRFTVA